jgi:hypothetical protein
MLVDDRASCQLVSHPNGIYELIWRDLSDMAVDDWLVYMDALYHHTEPDYILRLLYNIRTSDMPSLSFVARGIKQLACKYPVRSQSRTAIIAESDIASMLLRMMTRMLHRDDLDQTRFFTPDEHNTAIAWLLYAQ